MKKAIIAILLICSVQMLQAADAKATADTLLGFDNLRSGLCVYIGSRDAAVPVELAAAGNYHVHCLSSDQAGVEKMREYVDSKNLYGEVVVDHSTLEYLPYPGNLINVLVVEDFAVLKEKGMTITEIMRAVAPYGSVLLDNASANLRRLLEQAGFKDAVINKKDAWTQILKPRPEGMDDWSERKYDATQSRVSSDRLMEVPNSVQWIAEGSWQHETGPATMISMNGRVFSRYRNLGVVARDGFSGVKLWHREAGATFGGGRNGYPGCWIVTKNELFTRLKANGPLVALDPATGKTLRTYDFSPLILAYANGRMFTVPLFKESRYRTGPLTVYDAKSGKELWKRQIKGIAKKYSLTGYPLIIADGRIFLTLPETQEFLCLGTETGKELWRKPSQGQSLVWYRNGILLSGGHDGKLKIYNCAYSPEDGSLLWRYDYRPVDHGGNPFSVFYVKDLIWVLASEAKEGVKYKYEKRSWHGLDPKTGNIVRSIVWGKTKHHCYDDTATVRYIMSGGGDYLDIEKGEYQQFLGGRGGCTAGSIPANGLYYQSPNVCNCYQQIRGFLAFTADNLTAAQGKEVPDLRPRQMGPGQAADENPAPDDWPMFRHDSSRSGSTEVGLPAELTPLWDKEIGGRLSSSTAACGKVYVSSIDDHRVVALDMKTGKKVWSFRADGRIDSPPTIHAGQAIFGCRDGWLYSVSSATGELIWRQLVAPHERWFVCEEQVESAWPLFGSVLIEDDTVYITAGRHSDVDGGVLFYAIALKTGETLWQKRLDASYLPRGKQSPRGSLSNDILVGNDKTVCAGIHGFDSQTGASGKGVSLHSGAGFLTDTVKPIGGWHDLNYRPWWYKSGKGVPLARGFNLSFAGPYVFGFGTTKDKKGKFNGYQFFSNSREGKKAKVLWKQPFRKGLLPKALLHAGDKLYIAVVNDDEAANKGTILVQDAKDGKSLGTIPLDIKPKFDGMAAVKDNLIVVGQDGEIVCLGNR